MALENSGLNYVIVRPGGMERPTDSYKDTHNVRLSTADTLFGGQVCHIAHMSQASLTKCSITPCLIPFLVESVILLGRAYVGSLCKTLLSMELEHGLGSCPGTLLLLWPGHGD